jgi:ATP-dependent RNA helicase DeaD
LRETLIENAYDSYRVAVQSLAEEFDPLDIAAAAAKLAAETALGDETDDEHDIPQFDTKHESRPAHERVASDRKRRETKGNRVSPWESDRAEGKSSGHRAPKRRSDAMTRLIIKVGDQRNVRPKDLVGAITNEANVTGDTIGAIQIGGESCLVEVPEAVADKVLRALSRTTIKGQRVTARRERER